MYVCTHTIELCATMPAYNCLFAHSSFPQVETVHVLDMKTSPKECSHLLFA